MRDDQVTALLFSARDHLQAGRQAEAEQALRQVIADRPDYAMAHLGLAGALHRRGATDEAAAAYRAAITFQPDLAEAHYNLGHLLIETGQPAAGAECFVEAVRLQPGFAAAHFNLGTALRALGKLDEAAQSLITAAELRPDHPSTWNNLGNTLHDLGRLDRARGCFQQALSLQPDFQQAHDNLLLLSYCDPNQSPADILKLHREWGSRWADPLTAAAPPHRNDPDPDRPLRIGYVSPRFRESAEYFFIAPLLQSHDPAIVQVHGYSDARSEDGFTARLRSAVPVWRATAGLSDEQLAAQIREDRIDILVDLMGHGSGNRLMVFARKPAPVQVTYLGYPGTMGLTAIDYRFSDRHLDPPGNDDNYVETTLRLPGCYWCYQPWDQSPTIGPLPALTNGSITFGSLSRFDKISSLCVDHWSEVLKAIPNSRLMMHANAESSRKGLLAAFQERGVDAQRISFLPPLSLAGYLAALNQIDIVLDTWPCSGATTTCHALWMGVPVVTLTGPTVMGRSGSAILRAIGREDLVADSPQRYVQIASRLAADLPDLAAQRQNLRPRMAGSTLLDGKGFARGVEQAFREMWRKWCSELTSHPPIC